MPNQKIAIAWELGDNHGHLGRHVMLAESLKNDGHDVLFIARNTTIAQATVGSRKLDYIQAPIFQSKTPETGETVNYASILLASGYRRQTDLSGLLDAWLTSLSLYKPGLVIVDHAPTALLAARLLGIRTLAVGTGFELPPPIDPFPSLQPWKHIAPEVLVVDHAAALETINGCLTARGCPALPKLSSLFEGVPRLAAIIPELDPYGIRRRLTYVGPVGPDTADGEAIAWDSDTGPKIFAYLHNNFEELAPIVEALKRVAAEAVCVFPGVDVSGFPELPSQVRVYDKLVDVPALLPAATMCISNGGIGLATQCIGHRVPMVLIPTYLEQFLTAHRIQAMKAGIILPPALSGEQYAQAFGKVVQGGNHQQAHSQKGEDRPKRDGNATYLGVVKQLLSA